MLSQSEIASFYLSSPPPIPRVWKLSRKHFRAMLCDGRFVKLNKFTNRLNIQDLRFYCWKLRPLHAYFSILNWLFPEQVGKKYKARYCVPLNGEFVVDVDSYLMPFKHDHVMDPEWNVCQECLSVSRRLALQVCEAVENYYSKIAVGDWASYREKDPIWCHQTARFKFTRLLQKQTFAFDRRHFIVSVDPMRVVTVPNTLNAETGLVCRHVGARKDLEMLEIPKFLEQCMAFTKFHGYPEPLESSPEK